MSLQYLRKFSLILAGADGNGIDLSTLRCVFEIHQWELGAPNYAVVTVYNPSPATVTKVGAEFGRLVVEAGYDVPSTIFDGEVVQSYAGRENSADSYLKIIAIDGYKAHKYAIVRGTLAAGATVRERWETIAQAMEPHGVTLGYLPDDLPGGRLPRGRVYCEPARLAADSLADAHDQKWSIQKGKLQVVPMGEYLPGEAVVLSPGTGLVGIPQQAQDGIKARCLLNPAIRVGGAIQIDRSLITEAQRAVSLQGEVQNSLLPRLATDGFYRVIVAEHAGDTRGNDWYTSIAAVALRDPAPKAQVERGRS